ncbi:hypothetical protein GGX14DRAFT_587540 [Mycena pura]|uniref:F-box domain-containing protein n=1 Tax=Mycena pura TaxID=153505 RepID=A0AAD6UWH7_9AGAR|nr:hypothetical protein GGX14DRAFT_587540 [Mycena pura]
MSTGHDSSSDRARIADIDAEISKLERSPRILRSERDIIWERLDQYPVLTLPSEIVSEIFLKFIPVYPSCPPMMGIHSPSHLMRICRQWRDIALSTPQLWRAISTRTPVMLERTARKYARLVRTWLVRSGSCPLSIQLDYTFLSFAEDSLQAILPHSSRWEYISHIIRCPSTRRLVSAAPDAPRLRAATLWDCKYASGYLPWCQLTSLTLMYKSYAECAAILKETINLVHCRMRLIINGDEDCEADVNLPCLETLALDCTAPSVLGSFVVPSLHRLQVAGHLIIHHPSGELSSFIAKSGCKLQELCIIGRSVIEIENAYRKALSFIPSLSFAREFKWDNILDDEE